MKILGMMLVQINKPKIKVKMYELKEIDVPLTTVAANYLVDWETGFSKLFDIQLKGISRKVKGIICYENLTDLVDFLVDYYIPVNFTDVDRILKNTQGISRQKRKQLILELMIQENLPPPKRSRFFSWGERKSEQRIGPAFNYSFIFNDGYHLLPSVNGSALFKEAKYRQMFYKPNKDCQGYSLLMFVKRADWCLYWNGEYLQVLNLGGVRDRQKFLYEVLGKEGYLDFEENARAADGNREYFPPINFQIKYLLRVPAREEVDQYLKRKNIFEIKPPVDFGNILTFYNKISAINIDKKYPEITSVEEVISVLSRAPNNIYLPEEEPVKTVLEKYLTDGEYYLVGGVIDDKF